MEDFFLLSHVKDVFGNNHANVNVISKSIEGFDCDKASIDKSAVVKASILAKASLNIVSSYSK